MRLIALAGLVLAIGCGSDRVRAVGRDDTESAPARLVADRAAVDFGTTSLGDLSGPGVVRITNQGGQAASALRIRLSGADGDRFTIPSDTCSGMALAPGASCEVQPALRPEEERRFTATLRASSDASATEVALVGQGRNDVLLTISNFAFSFGGVNLNASASRIVRVDNAGTRASHRLALAADGDVSSFAVAGDCSGRALGPGEGCDLRVTFGPLALGARAVSVTVAGSALERATARFDGYGKRTVRLTVSARGDGQVSPEAQSCSGNPCALDFEVSGPVPPTARLAAVEGAHGLFESWSGDCAGATASCALSMDSDRAVVATFARAIAITFEGRSLAGGEGTALVDNGPSCNAPCVMIVKVRQDRGFVVRAKWGATSQFRWQGVREGARERHQRRPLALVPLASQQVPASIEFEADLEVRRHVRDSSLARTDKKG